MCCSLETATPFTGTYHKQFLPWHEAKRWKLPVDNLQVVGQPCKNIGIVTRWWQLKYFLNSPRELGKISNLSRAYFSDGLKPPGEKDLKTLDILREGDFDAVVLQEHSTYG